MTPELVIDAEVVRENVRRMAEYADRHALNLRPHTKTHKSLHVARLQLEAGAIGLTVAKVGEAEVMSQVCDDILVAYPIVDTNRCQRIANLARETTVRVAIDSELAARNLSKAADDVGAVIGILVDFDLGYGRTGVQSPEDAVRLGKTVDSLPGFRLDGIMTYTGHITGDDDTQTAAMQRTKEQMESLLDPWRASGLSATIISSGSTPAALHCHLAQHFTEIRPGTYVYNDMNVVRGGYGQLDQCAARVQATVISDAVPDQVVIDAGSKTFTSDQCGPDPDSGFGYIVQFPKAKIVRLTEEHGQVDVSGCESPPMLGEEVTVIPNHICVCVNMQNQFRWRDGDHSWCLPVDARGLLC